MLKWAEVTVNHSGQTLSDKSSFSSLCLSLLPRLSSLFLLLPSPAGNVTLAGFPTALWGQCNVARCRNEAIPYKRCREAAHHLLPLMLQLPEQSEAAERAVDMHHIVITSNYLV